LPLKYFFRIACLVSIALCAAPTCAEELGVHFKTTPRPELLRPFADPVDLSLLVTGSDGKPVKQGSVTLRLDAPAPGRFFSTDFPLLEGTLLNEMRLPLRQGKADWKYLFPIRGSYRLVVDVDADGGRKASKVFDITVREDRTKWLAFGVFSAALFVFGFWAGRIFTGARSPAIALIITGALSGSAGASPAQSVEATALEIEAAIVGKPALVRWRSAEENGAQSLQTLLSLTITHLEKEKMVFAIDKVPLSGEWSMKFHFPDGAEYRVAGVASIPGRPPQHSDQIVSVSGVEPPARAMAPAMAYFVGVIALGLAAGRWSKRGSLRK
jgi:hypothetical protein